jgi:polysaccharide export outer membrane protein
MMLKRPGIALLAFFLLSAIYLPVQADSNKLPQNVLTDIVVNNDVSQGWVSFEFEQAGFKPAITRIKQKFPDRILITILDTRLGNDLRKGLFYEDLFCASERGIRRITVDEINNFQAIRVTVYLGNDLNSYLDDFNTTISRLVLTSEELTDQTSLRLVASSEGLNSPANEVDELIYQKLHADLKSAGDDLDKQLEQLRKMTEQANLKLEKQAFDPNAKYKIQVGDQLDINIAGEPDFRAGVKVRPDGFITYPLLGDVIAEGLTSDELAMVMKNRLIGSYFNYDISLTVALTEYTPSVVYLLGNIPQAGPVTYRKGMTILDILGYFDRDKIDSSNVSVIRKGAGRIDVNLNAILKGDIDMNVELLPNDYILLPSTDFIRVMVFGKVRLPGLYRIASDSRIYDAIGTAGGFAPRCDIHNITIMRENDQGYEKIVVDLRKFEDEMDSSQNITLTERDIIFIPEVDRPDIGNFLNEMQRLGLLWYDIDRATD